MESLQETQSQSQHEKKLKKSSKDSISAPSSLEISETKAASIKISFEGESARRILKCEAELRDRLSKPDMGKILGAEILSWTEKRWSEIVEENTDIDYFFAQIRKCPDKSKSIKLLKALAEKLKSETTDGSSTVSGAAPGLTVTHEEDSSAELTEVG
jgi:hypothetical protein